MTTSTDLVSRLDAAFADARDLADPDREAALDALFADAPVTRDGDPTDSAEVLGAWVVAAIEAAQDWDDPSPVGRRSGPLVEAWLGLRAGAGEEAAALVETFVALLGWAPPGFFQAPVRLCTRVLGTRAARELVAQAESRRDETSGDESAFWGSIASEAAQAASAVPSGARVARPTPAPKPTTPPPAPAAAEAAPGPAEDSVRAWEGKALELETRGRLSEAADCLTSALAVATDADDKRRLTAKRALLWQKARSDTADQAALWEDFTRAPSLEAYQALVDAVPKSNRAGCHKRAMQRLESAGWLERFTLYHAVGELKRLEAAALAIPEDDLAALEDPLVGACAEVLGPKHPAGAGRLHVELFRRFALRKGRGPEGAALVQLKRSIECLARAKRGAEWGEAMERLRFDNDLSPRLIDAIRAEADAHGVSFV